MAVLRRHISHGKGRDRNKALLRPCPGFGEGRGAGSGDVYKRQHILRLEEIIPAGAIPLDSVKAELTEELLASKQETTFIQMIEEWKKDINIELHLDLIDMTQEEYDAIVSGEDTASEDDAAE